MKISSGLLGHMVLQRNGENVCKATFAGVCTCTGVLTASVSSAGGEVAGFARVIVGEAARQKVRGTLQGLPVGGPYAITLRIEDAAGQALEQVVVDDVLVGDVWVLAGQSNMEGAGALADAAPAHPMVRAWYPDDHWDVAADPLHNKSIAVDRVHADLRGGFLPAPEPTRGTGPGVAYGQEMYRLTGVPQGLIACAHGGASMAQWDPKLKKLRGGSLYGAMLRRVRRNGGRVAGIVWYQGCTDANPENTPYYTGRMKAWVRAARRDFADAALPIAAVQIARLYGDRTYGADWSAIREQQRRLPEVIAHCTVVPAIDLPQDDIVHLSGVGQQRLGQRLARAMRTLITGDGEPPIAVKKISFVRSAINHCMEVHVAFTHVQGGLQALGEPNGLSLVNAEGVESPVYRVSLHGNTAVMHTCLVRYDIEQTALYYGYGSSPYCNITDAADRALPAFGPVALGKPRAVTDFVRTWRVSAQQPPVRSWRQLPYPTELALTAHTFAADFCSRRALAPNAGDGIIYYACNIDCPEPMQLALLLGYDGPVKLWVDGRELFYDAHGTNPAIPDAASATFHATPGSHEILIALGTNGGRAEGLFLRCERRDLPQRLIARGQEHYVLPQITAGEPVLA
ncbi:MAG TPA: sialate O-acetylesterase [Armatimonadota bacterium]|jgi:sialate O-acetylesterase